MNNAKCDSSCPITLYRIICLSTRVRVFKPFLNIATSVSKFIVKKYTNYDNLPGDTCGSGGYSRSNYSLSIVTASTRTENLIRPTLGT